MQCVNSFEREQRLQHNDEHTVAVVAVLYLIDMIYANFESVCTCFVELINCYICSVSFRSVP